MKLLLDALEQIGRLLSEWAARRREVYVEPRPIDVLVEEAWGPRPVRYRGESR
jgi:hypothetical protein